MNEHETLYEAEPTEPTAKPRLRLRLPKKRWLALAAALLVLAGAGLWLLARRRAAAAGAVYEYVRTTTLTRTSLDDSVTVTGTVAAGSETSVTVDDAAKNYKIATVEVAVGDAVKKGDVIATLDTTALLESIAEARKSYQSGIETAQTSYDRAVASYETAVVQHDNRLIDLQEKITEADTALTKAKDQQSAAQSAYNAAQGSYQTVLAAYNTAAASLTSFQSAADAAANDLNASLTTLNSAIAAYQSCLAAASAENAAGAGVSEAAAAALESAAQAMINAYYAYNGNQGGNSVSLDAVRAEMSAAGVTNAVLTDGSTSYADSAAGRCETASRNLADAQSSVSSAALGYSSYQELSNALATAQNELDKAKTTLDSAASAVENAEKSVETAHDNYDTEKNTTTLTSQAQNVEDAKAKLESAKETPSTLTSLQKTLEACTLTANSDGTITALTAVVGSVCGGSVATIKDVNSLVVEVTVPAEDVGSLTVGMPCRITSDATGEAVIDGTLTQLDPTANDQGSFGAQVTVTGGAAGLLVGIQAQVEIIRTSTDDVFVVPLDAVGTAQNGSRYVLRCTGGSGTDMTFEEVPVTVGQSNGYYAEIAGDTLAEGDVIRSSADLTEGIATTGDAQEAQGLLDGMTMPGSGMAMGGEMPAGGQRGERPAGTGGAPGGR